MSKKSNITAGELYEELIRKERAGDYLGGTVQTVPHLTDLIKKKILVAAESKEVLVIEIGGTVGDIEGLPFLEAVRQFRNDIGRENVLYIHISLVLSIKAAGELKTKPTQHSVIKLREAGIEPRIIICRTEVSLGETEKNKISLFCNVERRAVIEEIDVGENIYKVPLLLHEENLDGLILEYFGCENSAPDLKKWRKKISTWEKSSEEVEIAVAGKYTLVKDAYKSIKEALLHAAMEEGLRVKIRYVDTDGGNISKHLKGVKAVLVPGGFGERGTRGKMEVCRWARENKIPFFGICLGMQLALIEIARAAGLKGADSLEFNAAAAHPVITYLPGQKKIKKKGGTMRLGAYPCRLKSSTKARKAYGKKVVFERHRHRFEVNPKYKNFFRKNGVVFSGIYPRGNLVEIMELKGHPWFVAVQFHPEFKSTMKKAHPLFSGFVKAAAGRIE